MSNARELSDVVSTDPSTDLNVDNNTLVVDVSTNKVGIGVTAPTEKLEVAGNLKIADEGTIGSATHASAISIASNGAVTIPNLNNPVINTGIGGTAVLDEDDLASDSDTQIATQQSIKAFVTSGTVAMANKTLTSPVINTGVSGTAFIDDDTFGTATSTNFASAESIKAYIDAQIAANSGGKVVFKSTGKASGNPTTGKTWVAFGSGEYVEPEHNPFTGTGTTKYARGYGYGDCISVNTGSGFVDDLPNDVTTVNWQYTLEYDNA